MKHRALLSTGVLLILASVSIMATLLGLTAGLPTTNFANPSSLSFAAMSGSLTIAATPTNTRFSGTPTPVVRLFDVSVARSLSIGVELNSDGSIAGGRVGDDLVLRGRITGPDGTTYDGTGATPLLTGEVVSFGYLNGNIDLFDFRFSPTGGLLAGFYANQDIAVSVQSDNGNTFAGVFTSNFVGNAKGNLGPVPLPPSQCLSTIGDFVWHDENRNGVQDVNEHGINGVPVTLTPHNGAVPPQTVVTGNSPTGQPGYYQFKDLCAGDYTVTTVTPEGTLPTVTHVGAADSDSNGSPTAVTLPTGASTDQTIDFGFMTICTGAIGDFVWIDANDNGVQDAGESGINGVPVQLLDGGGNVLASTTTTNSPASGLPGYYEFDGLCGGNYQVRVIKPAALDHFSPQGQGGDVTRDSDASPVTGTALVALPHDTATDFTIDIGLVPPPVCSASIGDFVWNDLNGNGIQEAEEPGLNGVLVELKDATGTLQSTNTVTHNGRAGYYQFSGLACSANYQVWVTRPAAYSEFSPATQGTDVAVDSNGIATSNGSYSVATVTLSEAGDHTVDQTIDFGFYACTGSIGDVVWNDVNGNGIQDAQEPGLPGVTLLLQNGAGQSLGVTAETDANGHYQFTGLCAGSYTVVVLSGVPLGFIPSPSAVGGDRSVDSNGSPAPVTLSSNFTTDQTIDFGFRANPAIRIVKLTNGTDNDTPTGPRIVIGGLVTWTYIVTNEGSEPLASVTVVDDNGTPAHQADDVTPAFSGGDANGNGQLDLTETWTYTAVGFAVAGQYKNWAVANAVGALSLVPAPQSQNPDHYLGYACTGAIGDYVWSDLDRDGLQDAVEAGLPGVTVTLTDSLGAVRVTTTDAVGHYRFAGLCAGAYVVTVATPAGYTPSPSANVPNPALDSNGSPAPVLLPDDDATDVTIDFGFYPTGRVGDFVWNDLNKNGIQDVGEPPIAAVKVTLTNGVTTTNTVTDANGFYEFTGLTAGTYMVTAVTPSGFMPTGSLAGADRAVDSNGSPTIVTLPANNSEDLTIDFGFVTTEVVCIPTSSDGSPLGTLTWNIEANGDVVVKYEQSRSVNDNSYGANAIGWNRRSFSQLVTSDQATFAFRDKNGNLVLDVTLDYLSTKAGTPSGYASLGASGGDGAVNVGSASSILSATTSLDQNLNTLGLCSAGTCTVAGTNLLVNSPAASASYAVADPVFGNWNFTNTYYMRIAAAAFGTSGFGSVALTAIHNSPSKNGVEAPTVSPCVPEGPPPPPAPAPAFGTFTQGGWGSKPSGNNPGRLLLDNFRRLYPSGSVKIGGTFTITLTSAGAIEKFLPQGSTAARLTKNYTNPTAQVTVLAGQVLALKLNVDFSTAGVLRGGLAALKVTSGPLAGRTVAQVLTLGNTVLGGGALPAGLTLSALNDTVTRINENFNDGTQDLGYLVP